MLLGITMIYSVLKTKCTIIDSFTSSIKRILLTLRMILQYLNHIEINLHTSDEPRGSYFKIWYAQNLLFIYRDTKNNLAIEETEQYLNY